MIRSNADNFRRICLESSQITEPILKSYGPKSFAASNSPAFGSGLMLLRRFLKNADGGAAPFLALSLIPLMGFTGAAIDYSRANALKVSMQAALDSTGLILSKDAQNLSGAALGARVNAIFFAQFNVPEAQNVSVSYQFSAPQQGSFSLKLTGAASIPTRFATLIGTSELSVSATSEILWGIKKLNLALALDNTGSMS